MAAENNIASGKAANAAVARPFIDVKGLTAAYDAKIVVRDVSFSVAAGEHLSLLGPSGCGKSTTLRCIAGLETPVEGEIVIDSEVVFSSHRGINVPTEKRNLSMVFQSYAIWPHMTVFENVAYGLRTQGVRDDEVRAKRWARCIWSAWRSSRKLRHRAERRPTTARGVGPQLRLPSEGDPAR